MTQTPQVPDPPTEFDALAPLEQQALRLWVRLALAPAPRFGLEHGRWHSYNLKHHAEAALGWSVSNGELKGAMLAEGYTYRECEGTCSHPSPNWLFRCRQRCPHRMGRAVLFEYLDPWGKLRQATTYGFACPGALWCGSLYHSSRSSSDGTAAAVTATYPALCQATPTELAEFNQVRHASREKIDARQARYRAARERQDDLDS